MHNKYTFFYIANKLRLAIPMMIILGLAGITLKAQTTISTTFANNNGFSIVTSNFTNNNSSAVVITDIASVCGLSGSMPVAAFYKASPINGAPGNINAANGWIQFGSATITAIANTTTTTPQTFMTGLTLTIPAGATYGIAVQAISLRYSTVAVGTYTNAGGGCVITSGSNVSYAGDVAPNPPTFTPRAFIGSIGFISAVPCSGTPNPGNTISSASSACSGIPFTLSAQNSTGGNGVTYQWLSSASGTVGSFLPITGASSSTYTTTITSATFYQVTVTCSGSTGTSTPLQVALTPLAGCYCASGATSTDDEDMFNVTLGTLNNTSTCTSVGTGPGSINRQYSNYTSGVGAPAAPDLIQGSSNPFSLQIGTCNGNWSNSSAIWIDFNQDGDFLDAGERVYFSPVGTTGAHFETGNVSIPLTAVLGQTRMRVSVIEFGTPASLLPCATYNWGETEDYNVKIIPCIPVTITTAPVSVSTVCGSNASFSVIAAGSLPTYQWQYRLNATSPWVDVMNVAPYTGATMATLNITNASTTLNGYQYRVRFGGACTSLDFTTFGTLTVSQLAAVVTPATASICKGSGTIVPISIGNVGASQTTTFSSAANLALPIPEVGTGVTNSIPVTLPSSAQITNIKVKMNIAHTWIGDMIIALKAPNGEVYNLSYALNGTDNGPGAFVNTVTSFGPNALGAVFPLLSTGTNPFTSTFRVDGRIASTATALDNGVNNVVRLTGPAGFTATTDVPLTFYGGSGAGTGNWTIAMYDFYDDGTNGGTINRLTNWSLDITYGALANAVFTSSPAAPSTIFTNAAATTLYDGVTAINTVYVKPDTTTIYSAAINTGTCTTTATIPVTVNTAIVGTPVVANKSACNGSNAVFTVTGITGGSGLSYQWQVSTTNPAVFSNIAGATSTSYTVLGAGQVNNSYRVIVTSAGCGSVTSSAGALTSNTNPVVTISAAPITSLFPGLFSTLTAAVSSASGTIKYQWKRNGVNSSIADTLNKAVVGIDGLGVYTVMVTDGNGCSSAGVSTPASITIKDSATTNRLFIYPSPNRGLFEVRFFNEGKAATAINIYDEKGAQVISQRFGANTAYQSMKFDMSGYAKGIYRVDVLSANGTRINTGSVLVY